MKGGSEASNSVNSLVNSQTYNSMNTMFDNTAPTAGGKKRSRATGGTNIAPFVPTLHPPSLSSGISPSSNYIILYK